VKKKLVRRKSEKTKKGPPNLRLAQSCDACEHYDRYNLGYKCEKYRETVVFLDNVCDRFKEKKGRGE
jgi:hypothetical protein